MFLASNLNLSKYFFRYFDLAHGGYFENKDLEDILLFSVSNLSRAQVKRLVAKVNSEKDKVGENHHRSLDFAVMSS